MNVFEAFSKVMGDVQGIRKGERNNQQGFNFRGIDTVLNAVGPVLRKYGVIIVPEAVSIETERYQTAKGAVMQGVITRMRYTVIGPVFYTRTLECKKLMDGNMGKATGGQLNTYWIPDRVDDKMRRALMRLRELAGDNYLGIS